MKQSCKLKNQLDDMIIPSDKDDLDGLKLSSWKIC